MKKHSLFWEDWTLTRIQPEAWSGFKPGTIPPKSKQHMVTKNTKPISKKDAKKQIFQPKELSGFNPGTIQNYSA